MCDLRLKKSHNDFLSARNRLDVHFHPYTVALAFERPGNELENKINYLG